MEILTTQVSQRRWTSWSSGPEPPLDPPEEPRKPRGSDPDASGRAARATKLPEVLPDLEPPADPATRIAS